MSQFTDKLRRIVKVLNKDDQHLAKNDDLIPDLLEELANELDEMRAGQGQTP